MIRIMIKKMRLPVIVIMILILWVTTVVIIMMRIKHHSI